MELKIDSEFKSLVPPLSFEEYKLLEESILHDGCRDALIIWADITNQPTNCPDCYNAIGFRWNIVNER